MAKDNKVSQQKELNELTLEYQKLKDAGKEKDLATIALGKEIKALAEEINKSAAIRLELAEKELENAQQNHAIMEKIAELDGDREGLQDTLIAKQESIVKLKEAELIALVDSVKLGKETEEQIIKRKKELQGELDLEREKLKLHQDQAEAYDAVEGKVANTVSGLLGSVDASKTFVGQLLLAKNHTGGMSGVISNVGKGLATALKPANVMAGLFAKVQESSMKAFVSMDNFRAELAKSGASLEQYGGLMTNTTDQTVAAGVSMQDAQQSILALHSGMSSFNTMNKADQQVLTNTTAIMSKLGVDAQTSAGNLDILTKSMGMNAKEADKATKEIAATAQALGVSQQKMAADFASAAPVLSAHGEAGVQIFRKLAAQSKATGIEMGALLGIANQFDTFEGAAEAAGKLNAVLGTQLNSIELLTASEDERIKILQQSVAASGKSWESMNKFEKQTVAAAAGISDVNEAGKLFGTTAQQMENAAGAAEKMALADKDLAKQAASASTAGEKLALIAERFGVVMIPLIDTVHFLLDGILLLNQGFGGYLIPTLVGFFGVILLITKAQQMALAVSKSQLAMTMLQWTWDKLVRIGNMLKLPALWALVTAKFANTTATIAETSADAASIPVKNASTAATTAAVGPTLAFGAAMLLVGIGVGLAAYGLSLFVASFEGMSVGMILAISLALLIFLGAMVAIAYFMMTMGAVAVGPLLAFGAAFLMMGIGIALAAYGLSLMVPQFVILAGIGASLITAALAVGMLTIAFGSLGMLSFVMIPIIIVLGKLTAGILALALALSFIKTDELRAVADMAQGLGSITLDSAVAFGKAMLETRETIVAIAKEPEAAQALTTMAQAFAPSPAGGGGTTTTTNNITSAATKSGGDSGNREIVLKLNKDVFARAVVNIFEKEQDLNKLG
tara:strand:+ start:3372 stop:6098 length:2727 start_codon:yes stop_codon:yes gene_type:complete